MSEHTYGLEQMREPISGSYFLLVFPEKFFTVISEMVRFEGNCIGSACTREWGELMQRKGLHGKLYLIAQCDVLLSIALSDLDCIINV